MRQRFHFITILWSIGYLLFLLASFLFFLIPNHEKKLFGFQFYSLPHSKDSGAHEHEIVISKPIAFQDLAKEQTILYSNKANGFALGIIKRIDLANYTITLEDDTQLTKEQCKGILQYSFSISSQFVPYAITMLFVTHVLLLFLLYRQWLKLYTKTSPVQA